MPQSYAYVLLAIAQEHSTATPVYSERQRMSQTLYPMQRQNYWYVGYGDIGHAVGNLARAFRMNVIALRRRTQLSQHEQNQALRVQCLPLSICRNHSFLFEFTWSVCVSETLPVCASVPVKHPFAVG